MRTTLVGISLVVALTFPTLLPMPFRHAGRLLVAAACVASAGACRSGSRTGAPGATGALPAGTASTSTTIIASPAPITTALGTTTPSTVNPGLLPQTPNEPSTGAELDARMQALWQAIVNDRVDAALPLFFPEPAYQRMKTGLLPNPAGDYASRLLGFYRLDVEAYHAYLGQGATLVGVAVASADAAWILPGHCENLIGYWHLPGVRLVYQEAGVTRSFAVTSLISWRGEWYVVHLGPNPRPSNVGTVALPAAGAGVPGPAGGC